MSGAVSLVDLKERILRSEESFSRSRRRDEKKERETFSAGEREAEEQEEGRLLHTRGVGIVLLLPDDASLTDPAVQTLKVSRDLLVKAEDNLLSSPYFFDEPLLSGQS